VLVVEDGMKLRDLLRSYLEREGHEVFTTGSGAEAITMALRSDFDLIILDLGLPDVDGIEVAREIRKTLDTPIIMLTARSEETDRVRGLEIGADDYVTKPFSPREFVLRAQAILRRGRGGGGIAGPVSYGEGTLILDEESRRATVRGQVIELTPTEWGLLLALARHPGRVYSRYELINRTRGYEYEGYERTVDSHVKNLRKKIELDPQNPQLVQTVLAGGYRLGVDRDT
jgi:DNA-binding response OmpR family regulator